MMRKVTSWTAALAALGLLLAAPVARAQERAILPFNGTDLKGWKLKGNEAKSKWVVGRAGLDEKSPNKLAVTVFKPGQDGGPGARQLVNASSGVDIFTEQKFGDGVFEVEFMVPKGSNSGVYLMGEYEIQI